jgi:hypothetical protein
VGIGIWTGLGRVPVRINIDLVWKKSFSHPSSTAEV